MAERLHIQTLGKLTTRQGSIDMPFKSNAKTTALLVYLAVTGEPARRERLMALLWPEMPAEKAAHNLRQTAYTLRKEIPQVAAHTAENSVPLLLGDRQTLALNPAADVHCDAVTFGKLLDGVLQHGHADVDHCDNCEEQLETAVSPYRRAVTLAAYIVQEPRSWHEMRAIATAVLDAVRPYLSETAYAAAVAEDRQLCMETAVSSVDEALLSDDH